MEKKILWKIKEKFPRCHISILGGAQNEKFCLGCKKVLHRPWMLVAILNIMSAYETQNLIRLRTTYWKHRTIFVSYYLIIEMPQKNVQSDLIKLEKSLGISLIHEI